MEENLKASTGQEDEEEDAKMTTTTTLVAQAQLRTTSIAAALNPRTVAAALPSTIGGPSTSSKALKRCLSVPIIRTLPGGAVGGAAMTTRSAAAAAAAVVAERQQEMMPMKCQQQNLHMHTAESGTYGNSNSSSNQHIHIGIPRSTPSSREVSPAPVFNIFAPRARRYSASYSPLSAAAAAAAASQGAVVSAAVTPRVSQLRQEECVDLNSREQNHEREVHSAMQMSQSWEDLTLVAENWSCKSDEFSNPLQVMLPSGVTSCSSPSPTSNRAGLRLPYGLSPSPTRRTFATRRSMSPSPIAMRPSQLGPVKRKFELDDNNSSNWNVYSPPPLKKFVTESRGSSPICQSPSSVCPSPDSGTFDGRITPKILISKLCTSTNNNNNSACSSPMSASPSSGGVITEPTTATSTICLSSLSSSSSSSSASSISGGSEPMCIGSGSQNLDEGISISDEKQQLPNRPQPMSTDMQDEAAASTLYAIMMDDMKSETSSIGGCSSISVESSSCDGGKTTASASFLNKLNVDDFNVTVSTSSSATPSPSLSQKNFFINKQSLGGAKKFIVHHDNLPNTDTTMESMKVVRSTPTPAHTHSHSSTRHGEKAADKSSLIVEHKL